MKAFDLHFFVCENSRPSDNPKGCCSSKGAAEFTSALKELCKQGTAGKKVRINKAGCLDMCAAGPVAVVYPEGTWYRGFSASDAQEIYEQHILQGKVVERLKA